MAWRQGGTANTVGIVYKITFPDGSYYIGQTRNFERRMQAYKELKCESQPLIYNRLKKYGFSRAVVSVLSQPLIEHLEETEIMFIKSHRSCYRDNPEQGLNVLKESYEEYKKLKHKLPKYNKGRRTKKVIQSTIWGDQIRSWGSVLDIHKITGLPQRELLKILRKKTNRYYAGYEWSYEKDT